MVAVVKKRLSEDEKKKVGPGNWQKLISRPHYKREPDPGLTALSEGEHQGVNGDSFRQRHPDDRDSQDVAEGTGVAAHRLSSGESDQSNADARASAGHAQSKGAVEVARLGDFNGRGGSGLQGGE